MQVSDHARLGPCGNQSALPLSGQFTFKMYRKKTGSTDSLQLNFADLNDGLGISVVGDVGKDSLRMWGEGSLKGLGRIEIEVTHRNIGRGRPRRAAGYALFNRHALAGGTQLLLHHWHVLVEIIGHIELTARAVGIKHTHLDHALLLVVYLIAPQHRLLSPTVEDMNARKLCGGTQRGPISAASVSRRNRRPARAACLCPCGWRPHDAKGAGNSGYRLPL